jgi:hypothetical protein
MPPTIQVQNRDHSAEPTKFVVSLYRNAGAQGRVQTVRVYQQEDGLFLANASMMPKAAAPAATRGRAVIALAFENGWDGVSDMTHISGPND